MRIVNKIFAFALMLAVTAQQFSLAALACGPSFVEPVFALERSPDVPLENFIRGRIGIVKPTWGRKSLFIAFRGQRKFRKKNKQTINSTLKLNLRFFVR